MALPNANEVRQSGTGAFFGQSLLSFRFPGNTVAAVYHGPLAGATSPSAVWNQLIPVFSGQSITSSTLYGPNITIPGAPVTTGNTVIGNYVLGFAPTGTSNSYVATIPEPSTWGLLGPGAAMAAIIRQRRLRTA